MAALVLALAIFVSAVPQAAVAGLVGGEYRSELTGDVALCHTAPPRPALRERGVPMRAPCCAL